MTNSPTYPQQLEMVKKYDALNVDNDNSLTGMPAAVSIRRKGLREAIY